MLLRTKCYGVVTGRTFCTTLHHLFFHLFVVSEQYDNTGSSGGSLERLSYFWATTTASNLVLGV